MVYAFRILLLFMYQWMWLDQLCTNLFNSSRSLWAITFHRELPCNVLHDSLFTSQFSISYCFGQVWLKDRSTDRNKFYSNRTFPQNFHKSFIYMGACWINSDGNWSAIYLQCSGKAFIKLVLLLGASNCNDARNKCQYLGCHFRFSFAADVHR